MATNNAINSNIPIEVTKGGTGAATLTDGGVLVGSGTGAVTALAVGSTGQLLVGATGGDPAFSSTISGTGASPQTLTLDSSTAGAVRLLVVKNTDNTNGASVGKVRTETGGASSGDPLFSMQISGVVETVMGIDNDDSDKFKIASGSALGAGNDAIVITRNGERTMPLQPAFLAYLASTENNVTGDNTAYTLGGGATALTEIFDQNSDFATATFTAPITGRYIFHACVTLTSLTASHTGIFMEVSTSNRTYRGYSSSFSVTSPYTSVLSAPYTCIADMDASDTATITVRVSGSTLTVDVNGGANANTFFGGALLV